MYFSPYVLIPKIEQFYLDEPCSINDFKKQDYEFMNL